MGNYGMYGFKPYKSKKGKQWNNKKYNNISKNNDDYYNFVLSRASELEYLENSGEIYNSSGLFPYAFIPIEQRTSYTKKYFGIEEYETLKNSLNYMLNVYPFNNADKVVTNRVTLSPITLSNGSITFNYAKDYHDTVLYRDNISRDFLNNTIIVFCFEYVLPRFLFNLQIYDDIIKTIFNSINFYNRSIILRTDIMNNRILFMISNVIEDDMYLNRYKELYSTYQTKLYRGEDILFTKHGNFSVDTLSDSIKSVINNYINNYIMIRKCN